MPVAQLNKDPRKKIKSQTQTQSHNNQVDPPTSPSDFSDYIELLRQTELPSLFPAGPQSQPTLYLDSSGSPPVPKSLLQAHYKDLEANLFGNPHSQNPSSGLAAKRIEEVRNRVCKEIFGVDRYPIKSQTKCSAKGKERERNQDQDEGWEIIFTASATASLKLAAECFNFGSSSSCVRFDTGSNTSSTDQGNNGNFIHTIEAHTSLIELREVVNSSTLETENLAANRTLSLSEEEILEYLEVQSNESTKSHSLIAFPLQCNSTGLRSFSFLDQLIQSRKSNSSNPFCILLDASSYMTSASRLDLSSHDYLTAPDLIAFSFPKMFGLTGLGGLLVKRSLFNQGLLDRKSYFGGGTLSAQAFQVDEQQRVEVWKQPSIDLAKRLEDGSPNTHSIISVGSSLNVFQRLLGDWSIRSSYLESLTMKLFQRMGSLQHGNGDRVVKIYTRSKMGELWAKSIDEEISSTNDQGPILLFNLLSPSSTSASNQSIVPPSSVSRLATLSNIHLRTGRHCNVGVIQNQLGSTPDQIKELWEKGIGCGVEEGESEDQERAPSSAIRVSLSIWNTENDINRFVDFIERFFVVPLIESPQDSISNPEVAEMTLQSLTIYPIKSASGQRIPYGNPWELCSTGLKYDREWCLLELNSVDQGGEMKILSQKKFPSMARIRPSIDLANHKMSINLLLGENEEETSQMEEIWRNNGWYWEIEIGLEEGQDQDETQVDREVQVCQDKVAPTLIERPEVIDFFSRFLGINCTLARMPSNSSRHSKLEPNAQSPGDTVPISFSNESPFLLLNSTSIESVKNWIEEDQEGLVQTQTQEYEDERDELDSIASRFRGNFIVGPTETLISRSISKPNYNLKSKSHQVLPEDSFTKLSIGPHLFGVLGACRRCEMIALDSKTGTPKPETLLSLARRRRGKNGNGRVEFGLHLFWNGSKGGVEGETPMIQEGMKVRIF